MLGHVLQTLSLDFECQVDILTNYALQVMNASLVCQRVIDTKDKLSNYVNFLGIDVNGKPGLFFILNLTHRILSKDNIESIQSMRT